MGAAVLGQCAHGSRSRLHAGKNVPGSLSALLILETGEPFAGGLYMLPQYRVAIAVRQGICLLHRSGDPEVGLHGNSAIHLPTPSSHRISVRYCPSEWLWSGGCRVYAHVMHAAHPAVMVQ